MPRNLPAGSFTPTRTPSEVWRLSDLCQCDSPIDDIEKKFKTYEQEYNSQFSSISNLEGLLKQMSPKYRDMSIEYYFSENAKLGEQG